MLNVLHCLVAPVHLVRTTELTVIPQRTHLPQTMLIPGWLAGEVERETETDGVAQGKHSDNDVEGASKVSA